MGMIRDLRAIAITFKQTPDILEDSRRRILAGFMNRGAPDDDVFLFDVLTRLRGEMTAVKLVPAGVLLVVTSEEHFSVDRREMKDGVDESRSADVRVTARDVGDVLERRFGEIWFAKGMFSDHSPKSYEFCLEALRRGVINGSQRDI
jgi:hypothetical protein